MTAQIVKLRGATQRYAEYGTKGIKDLIPEGLLANALTIRSTMLASVYLENNGHNNFKVKLLPVEAQFSPLYGTVVTDLNEDGNLDLLAVGNSYASETLSRSTTTLESGITFRVTEVVILNLSLLRNPDFLSTAIPKDCLDLCWEMENNYFWSLKTEIV